MEAKKVWIYASKREITPQEIAFIENSSSAFLSGWESHGSSVPGDISIQLNHFIVIKAGDCGDSMCGRAQDAQVSFIKSIDESLQLDLLNRMQVQYISNEAILSESLTDFKDKIKSGEVNEDTIVFNNTISAGSQFPNEWKVKLSESWHSQLM